MIRDGKSIASISTLVACLVMAVLVALVRYLTGPEWALSIFFVVPISLATWRVNRAAGLSVAVFSAIGWLTVDLFMVESFSSIWVPLINEMLRTGVFLIVVVVIDRLKKTQKSLEQMARIDELTGLANRRALSSRAPFWVGGAQRNQHKIAVGYLDVDHFKQINDLLGHHEGDKVLRVIGEFLRQESRITDMTARIGGDEFAVFWCLKSATPVCQIATGLLNTLTRKMRENGWPVTFSLGLAVYLDQYPEIDSMIAKADSLMYQAKLEGRNQIRKEIIGKPSEAANHKSVAA